MPRSTSIALTAALLIALTGDCQAQSPGGDALASALLAAPVPQDGTVARDPARLGTFFAFDPSYRGDSRVALSSGQKDPADVVVPGRPGDGSIEPPGQQESGPRFFAYDPAFGAGR